MNDASLYHLSPSWRLERTEWLQLVNVGIFGKHSKFTRTFGGWSTHSPGSIHHCLCVDGTMRRVTLKLFASKRKATAAAFARCCKSFENQVLSTLWEVQDKGLAPLFRSLPEHVWEFRCDVDVPTTPAPLHSATHFYSLPKDSRRSWTGLDSEDMPGGHERPKNIILPAYPRNFSWCCSFVPLVDL